MKIYPDSLPNQLPVLSLVGSLLLALALVSTALATPPPVIVRASVSSAGVEGNGDSSGPAISANGRFVAFASYASNLVSGDNNGGVFVRDLKTGKTQLVSVDSTGAATFGDSYYPALSADGHFVAFASTDELVPGGNNGGTYDVFVRNLKTGVTQRVSVDSAGTGGNNYSSHPTLSANGRFVAFESWASNLVADDNNNAVDIFVRDLKTGVTQRVSVDSKGAEGNSDSHEPVLSANGYFVAFESLASNLVAGDDNNTADVFVRDLKTGMMQLVSRDNTGAAGNGNSFFSALSANGRFVAFNSHASNLVVGDNNGIADCFVRDLKIGVTQRVSVGSTGAEIGVGGCFYPALSANGRFVAFESEASNQLTGDGYHPYDVFVRDLKIGVTQLVAHDNTGGKGYWRRLGSALSANGRFVAFESFASNLVMSDNNGVRDVFVRRLLPLPHCDNEHLR